MPTKYHSADERLTRNIIMKTRSGKLIEKSIAKKSKVIPVNKRNIKRSKASEIEIGFQSEFSHSSDEIQTRSKTLVHLQSKEFLPSLNPIDNKKLSEPMSHGQKKEKALKRQQKTNGRECKEIVEVNDYRVFVVGDIVWVKLKGWAAWPGKASVFTIFKLLQKKRQFEQVFLYSNFRFQITKIIQFSPFKLEVLFFNDGRTSTVFASQLQYLMEGFSNNAKNVRKNPKVNKAAEQAMIAYFFSKDLHRQFIVQ